MIGCLQVVRLQFHKNIKLYTWASYIVFFFVKSENNHGNFIKEKKTNYLIHCEFIVSSASVRVFVNKPLISVSNSTKLTQAKLKEWTG